MAEKIYYKKNDLGLKKKKKNSIFCMYWAKDCSSNDVITLLAYVVVYPSLKYKVKH